jgi:ribosome-binding factor A
MKHRQRRVNEVVKRELSGIIAREIRFDDALVSINDVEVAADLKSAHVFVSVLGAATGPSVIEQLEEHRSDLQTALARRVVLKYTPHLVFHLDESIERGTRVIQILQEMEATADGNE